MFASVGDRQHRIIKTYHPPLKSPISPTLAMPEEKTEKNWKLLGIEPYPLKS